MTTKVYNYTQTRVLKDGTVKTYEKNFTKQVKNEPGTKQTRQKKTRKF